MTSIRITLHEKPAMWNYALPSLANPQLTELSDLAHGQFEVRSRVKTVETTLVGQYLKHLYGRRAPRLGSIRVPPKLFLHVLSSYLYDMRLKTASSIARLDHRTEHLVQDYDLLHRQLAHQTLDSIRKAGLSLSGLQGVPELKQVESAKTVPGLHAAAENVLAQHADVLKRVQNNPSTTESDDLEVDLPPELNPDRLDQMRPSDAIKGRVYLTIDDGPGRWTDSILNQFKNLEAKHGVSLPATFFFTGANMDAVHGSDGLLRKLLDSGHDVGGHGNLHHEPDLEDTPTPEVLAREIENPRARFENVLGKPLRWFRFPGGRMSFQALFHLFRLNLTHVDWSIDPRDWHLAEQAAIHRKRGLNSPGDQIASTFNQRVLDEVAKAKDGDVVLLHESAPLNPSDRVFGMPLTWSDSDMKREDIVGRQLRANARGQFLSENLEPIVDTLLAKKLQPVPLSQHLSDYSLAYIKRYVLKIGLSMPWARNTVHYGRRFWDKMRGR